MATPRSQKGLEAEGVALNINSAPLKNKPQAFLQSVVRFPPTKNASVLCITFLLYYVYDSAMHRRLLRYWCDSRLRGTILNHDISILRATTGRGLSLLQGTSSVLASLTLHCDIPLSPILENLRVALLWRITPSFLRNLWRISPWGWGA